MANFQGQTIGALLTLLGWDGTAFRNLKTDSDGHLQIDALSTALPTDAATETSLAKVVTAIELIDDLRAALDSVGTDELNAHVAKKAGAWTTLALDTFSRLSVSVDGSVLPTGAATETSLQGIEDNIPDQLIGYVDTYDERALIADAAAGSNTITGSVVPASELWVVTCISMFNTHNAVTGAVLYRTDGTTVRNLTRVGALAVDISVDWVGRLILKEGESIKGILLGCTLNDTLYMDVQGWKASI